MGPLMNVAPRHHVPSTDERLEDMVATVKRQRPAVADAMSEGYTDPVLYLRDFMTVLDRQARDRLEAFKAKVAEAACDAAEEHDWCGVARDLIEDLGMTWPSRNLVAVVDVRYVVTFDSRGHRAQALAGGDWLRDTFQPREIETDGDITILTQDCEILNAEAEREES